MHGPFIPPEPAKGDPNTIGGYAAVHGRPAAFEGIDGLSYSVELATDSTGESVNPYGAFILFLRWNETAEPVVTGHLESAFLEFGESASEALEKLGRMPLSNVRELLDKMIKECVTNEKGSRPWWEVMNDEDDS
jgi:hypothetical protein